MRGCLTPRSQVISVPPLQSPRSSLPTYHLKVTIQNGVFSKSENGIYCVSKVLGIKYRTKETTTNCPLFGIVWDIILPEDQQTLQIFLCKHSMINTRIDIGIVTINLLRVGIGVQMNETFRVFNTENVVGSLRLSLFRETRPIDQVFTNYKEITQKFTLTSHPINFIPTKDSKASKIPMKNQHHRFVSQQLPQPESDDLIIPTGLFSAVFIITPADITAELKSYRDSFNSTPSDLCSSTVPPQSVKLSKRSLAQCVKTESPLLPQIVEIGLSGKVKSCYPPNVGGRVVPLNIWNFCFGDGLHLSHFNQPAKVIPFVMTDATGTTKFATFLVAYFPLKNDEMTQIKDLYPHQTGPLYSPCAIGVTSEFPILGLMRKWLKTIYEGGYDNKKMNDIFHEVIYMTGKPGYGSPFSYNFADLNFYVEIRLEPKLGFPSTGVSFLPLLGLIGVEGILCVVLSLLADEKVIVVSKSKTAVVYAIEQFKSLISPFEWCNVCIDLLPLTMIDYLTSPMTYLIGICQEYKEEMLRVVGEEEVVVCDLDAGTVMKKGRLRKVPTCVLSVLYEMVKMTQLKETSVFDVNSDCYEEKYFTWKSSEKDKIIQLGMFKIMCLILSKYEDYVRCSWVTDRPDIYFERAEYLEYKGEDFNDLFEGLFTSQHFQFFIEKYKENEESVFCEWNEKLVFQFPLEKIVKMYSNKKEVLKIVEKNPTHKTGTVRTKIEEIEIDARKLRSLRVRESVNKSVGESITYHKKRWDIRSDEVFADFFSSQSAQDDDKVTQTCELAVEWMLRGKGEDRVVTSEWVFGLLSKRAGRKLFFTQLARSVLRIEPKDLTGKGSCQKTIKKICVSVWGYSIITETFRQVVKYAKSDKDVLTLKRVVQFAMEIYKENTTKEVYVIESLRNETFEEEEMWHALYLEKMWNDKQRIFNGLSVLEILKKCDTASQTEVVEYRKQEGISLVNTFKETFEMMKRCGVGEKCVKKFVGYELGRLRVKEAVSTQVHKAVENFWKAKTSVQEKIESVLTAEEKKREMYDSVYVTETN